MKKFLAVFGALAMAFALVTPAFAAGISSAEQKLLDAFQSELYTLKARANLDDYHIGQYMGQAESALANVDLSDAACKEFEDALTKIDGILATSKSRADMWSHYAEIAGIVNEIGAKYYDLHVEVDSKSYDATVTWTTPTGEKATAGTGGKVIKQTGFGLGQTAAVVTFAVATLAGAFVVARKKQLFVA